MNATRAVDFSASVDETRIFGDNCSQVEFPRYFARILNQKRSSDDIFLDYGRPMKGRRGHKAGTDPGMTEENVDFQTLIVAHSYEKKRFGGHP